MRLLAINLTDRDAEIVADRCWQAGAAGLWEVDDTTLRAGVDDHLVDAFVTTLADLSPRDVTETEAVELAGRSVTVEMAGHEVELWVPATVFGDGTHPTTATCVDLLDGRVLAGDTVLDVGCGTGALSIAAALMGARVTAIDIDHVAVATTTDNAVRNGVVVSADRTPLSGVDGVFDVVVANLTVGALLPLVPDLVARARPGGVIVVSGLLEAQWEDVRGAIGAEAVDVRTVDGWVSAALVAQ